MRFSSRRSVLHAIGAAAGLLVLPNLTLAAPGGGAQRRPNIVFFLVDDMGWMDSTVYGSRYYETPNMERLAERGMRFTDAYAANPLCSPTRASILTGKYPARLEITTPAGHLPPLPDKPLLEDKLPPHHKTIFPRSRRFLPPGEFTIAEALRKAGYKTAHIGKWHLGVLPKHWPEAQGFELSFHGAPDPGPRSYFSPYQFPAGTVTDGPEGEYITDRVTDEALAFIEANKDRPFLLHLWHYAVHGPWGHKEEITRRFVGKKDPRGKQGNPIMASMLKSVDESLGRLLDKLDELRIADNTVIVFFSDNGGNVHSNTPGDRKRAPKGSRRWKLLQDWRRWAGDRPPTNNAPLRGGKAMIFEGGVREPMMVCWPGVVEPGSRCAEVVSSIDFYPTLLEIAGARPKPGQVVDGVSLMPLLTGKGKLDREAVFCHFPHGMGGKTPPATSVRKGPWKLIRSYETSPEFPDRYMLFHLEKDIGETNNLAAKMPERVEELDALISKFLDDTGALVPKPNPAYMPWAPSHLTTAKQGDGFLEITSDRRPHIHTREVRGIRGRITVRFRMRSDKGQGARVYWATTVHPQFSRERFKTFEPRRDGAWHEYAVEVQLEGPATGLRIDPSIEAGRASFDWIRVETPDGAVLRQWDFGGPA